MAEKIDESKELDSYMELVNEVVTYIRSKEPSIKDRLSLERKLKKYQEGNSIDWLLNLIISVDKLCQMKKENN